MKAKDLMIGDWVKINDVDYPKPLQVCGITKKHGTFLVSFPNVQCEEDLVEPIPLTKEILEMNGFYSTDAGYFLDGYNGYDGNVVIYDDWNHNLIITKKYKTIFDMEYFDDMNVHELQHALRLLGIDKEIKMEAEK